MYKVRDFYVESSKQTILKSEIRVVLPVIVDQSVDNKSLDSWLTIKVAI